MTAPKSNQGDRGPGPPRRKARSLWITIETTPDVLLIKDVGHAQGMPTVTNDAEAVVATLVESGELGRRRLRYVDSDGATDEMLVRRGRFVGFAPRPPSPRIGQSRPMQDLGS